MNVVPIIRSPRARLTGTAARWQPMTTTLNAFSSHYLAFESSAALHTSGGLDLKLLPGHSFYTGSHEFAHAFVPQPLHRGTILDSTGQVVRSWPLNDDGRSWTMHQVPGPGAVILLEGQAEIEFCTDMALLSPLWSVPFDLVPVKFEFAKLPQAVAIVYGAIKLIRDIMCGRAYRDGMRARRHRGTISIVLRVVRARRLKLRRVNTNHTHQRHSISSAGDDDASFSSSNVVAFTRGGRGRTAEGTQNVGDSSYPDRSYCWSSTPNIRDHQHDVRRCADFIVAAKEAA